MRTLGPCGRKAVRRVVHKQKDGPRNVIFTSCGVGVADDAHYYNIIDYDGDMADYVNITRHKSLDGAMREAKRFALDRKWAGPGTSVPYEGLPPRTIRTVKFIEMSRVDVNGPIEKCSLMPQSESIVKLWDAMRRMGRQNAQKPRSSLK